ncbi:hypothetical protein [Photobacterium alginatilyticum]
MPFITGLFKDGSEYKKAITKRTRCLQFCTDALLERKDYEVIDLSSLSHSPNVTEISFGKSLTLTQSNMIDLSKCKKVTELSIMIDNSIDLSRISDLEIKYLRLSCINPTSLSLKNIPSSVTYLVLDGPFIDFNLSDVSSKYLKKLYFYNLNFDMALLPKLNLPESVSLLEFSQDIANSLSDLRFGNCSFSGVTNFTNLARSNRLRSFIFDDSDFFHLDVSELCNIDVLGFVKLSDPSRLCVSEDSIDIGRIKSSGMAVYSDSFELV